MMDTRNYCVECDMSRPCECDIKAFDRSAKHPKVYYEDEKFTDED